MNPLRHAELYPLGERVLIVRPERREGGPDAAVMRALAALAETIGREAPPGLSELVPAGYSLAIHYDPLKTGFDEWRRRVEAWIGGLRLPDGDAGRIVEIPVCYGGDFGPDLPEVARRAGIGENDAVLLHSGAEYVVGMIGFAPGFPYLYGLPDRLATPRRAVPRTKVPAGSVAIGGGQTGIYPADLPGGWHIIGRTPVSLFDPEASPPSMLSPGDRVRFVPVDETEYGRLLRERSVSGKVFFGVAASKNGDGEGRPGGDARSVSGGELCHESGGEPGGGSRGKPNDESGGTETGVRNGLSFVPSIRGISAHGGGAGCPDGAIIGFRVRKPGLYTTLQDFGRPGFQRYGVTPGGAMDLFSFRLANRLVGNRSGEAALEMTLTGPELEVLADGVIAYCGADMEAAVNGRTIPAGRPVRVKAGDLLRFGAARAGCRAYLAVSGGFAVSEVLGGRGACPAARLPGLLGRALAPGDELPVGVPAGRAFGGSRDACGNFAPGAGGARAKGAAVGFAGAAAKVAGDGVAAGGADTCATAGDAGTCAAVGDAGTCAAAGDAGTCATAGGAETGLSTGEGSAVVARKVTAGTAIAASHEAAAEVAAALHGESIPVFPSEEPAASRIHAPPSAAASSGLRTVSWWVAPLYSLPVSGQVLTIRAMPGPEFGRLSPEAASRLLERVHTVGNRSDRMGLRLIPDEPIPSPEAAGMISEGVAWGTVQLPPGGEPIVLAADRQTIGGYPRVLQVIAADLPLLGQSPPGTRILFRLVDHAGAVEALVAEERRVRMAEWAIDRKWAEWSEGWAGHFRPLP